MNYIPTSTTLPESLEITPPPLTYPAPDEIRRLLDMISILQNSYYFHYRPNQIPHHAPHRARQVGRVRALPLEPVKPLVWILVPAHART